MGISVVLVHRSLQDQITSNIEQSNGEPKLYDGMNEEELQKDKKHHTISFDAN